MKTIRDLAEFSRESADPFATSPWMIIDQQRITDFAELTEDRQWIHVDVERARRESPSAKTMAHGYLLLSLLPALAMRSYRIEGFGTKLNYGIDSLRFLNPVPVDSRIRAHFSFDSISPRKQDSVLLKLSVTVEIEGQEKPACVVKTCALLLP